MESGISLWWSFGCFFARIAIILLQILEKANADRNAANPPATPASSPKVVVEAPRPDGQTGPSRTHDDSSPPQPSNVSAKDSQAVPSCPVADSQDIRLPGAGDAPVTSGRGSSTVGGGHGVVVKVRGVASAAAGTESVAGDNAKLDTRTNNSRHDNDNNSGTNGANVANVANGTNETNVDNGGDPSSATDDKINARPSEEWSDQFRDRRLMEDTFRRKALLRRLFLSPGDSDGDEDMEYPEEQSGGKGYGKRSCGGGGGFGRENGKGAWQTLEKIGLSSYRSGQALANFL